MPLRRPLVSVSAAWMLFAVTHLQAASIRTQNFVVEAPTAEIAQRFGQMAEQYRKQKALEWLGQEMPPWSRPCPLYVKPELGGAGGATTFNYDFRGGYAIDSMKINGDLERMLHSVLPHEVTHTVFAHYFRYPVPRWADEGGSVLSEDDRERSMHDRMCRDLLNHGQATPLRRLFQVREYQEVSNVMILYAEGFSISNYLVSRGGRQAFLAFVALGMRGNWDQAVQTYYHVQSVEELEQAWLAHLRATKNGGTAEIAQNTAPRGTDIAGRLVTRQTAPPAQPLLESSPTVRGQSDDEMRGPNGRPVPFPPFSVPPPATPAPASRSQSIPASPPPVRLGLPVFGKPASPPPQSADNSKSVGQGN